MYALFFLGFGFWIGWQLTQKVGVKRGLVYHSGWRSGGYVTILWRSYHYCLSVCDVGSRHQFIGLHPLRLCKHSLLEPYRHLVVAVVAPCGVSRAPCKSNDCGVFFVATGAALWWWIVFLSSSRGTMLGVAFGVL
jgi:hypothetical protein